MSTDASVKKAEKTNRILTPEFRVSYPFLFAPQKPLNPDQKAKYSVVMLFDKKTADLTPLRKAILAAIQEKWGVDKAKWPKSLHNPLKDGVEKDKDGYGEGVMFATASSVPRPGLVDQNVQPIIDPSEFYAGCYAHAKIDVYAFEAKDPRTGAILNRGVSLGLLNVQKIRDGEPFSGRSKPENDFDAIAVPATSAAKNAEEDPLAGI
jgi:hypothetical protein